MPPWKHSKMLGLPGRMCSSSLAARQCDPDIQAISRPRPSLRPWGGTVRVSSPLTLHARQERQPRNSSNPNSGRPVRCRSGRRSRHDTERLPVSRFGGAMGRSRLAAISTVRSHEPILFRPVRATPDGALRSHSPDFAQVKVKNARHGLNNPNARYRKLVTEEDVLASPMVADPLRLLDICSTSDGGAAIVLTSMDFARRHLGADSPVQIRAISTVTPKFPNTMLELPQISADSAAVLPPAEGFRDFIATAAYEEAGMGPEDMSLAEVYDLSTAFELDWYEHLGLCGKGEAQKLLRDGETTIGGKIPVNLRGVGLLRRSRPGPGDRTGLRDHLATPRPSDRASGRECVRRNHREPGPVWAWVQRSLVSLTGRTNYHDGLDMERH